MGELNGKVAVVTGAGRLRSIGYATALALADLGADVVVTGTGRDPDTYPPDEKEVGWRDIESTAQQIRERGRRALPVVVDVTRTDQVDAMVEQALGALGRIDILVNNAAYAYGPDRVPIGQVDPDVFQKVVDVKIRGAFLCTRAVVRVLREQGEGGKIVNISSGSGKSGSAETLAYNAGSFALVGMTQSLAAELGPHGINVNCVCPGTVDTARLDTIGRGETWREIAAATPMGRTGTPQEVAGLIGYLCTEAASWIQGQSINIDGGGVMEH